MCSSFRFGAQEILQGESMEKMAENGGKNVQTADRISFFFQRFGVERRGLENEILIDYHQVAIWLKNIRSDG